LTRAIVGGAQYAAAAIAVLILGGSVRAASRAAGAEIPAAVAQWPPVTERPALTEAELAGFIKANTIAEDLRQQAEERYVSKLPSYSRPGSRGRGTLAGVDFAAAVAEWERLTSGIEANACATAEVSYDEYRSIYKRLVQVNELIELQLKIAGKREAVGRLAQRDLRDLAQEQLRAQRQLEQGETRSLIESLDARRARLAQRRHDGQAREERRAAGRLKRIPGEEQQLQARIAQFHRLIERERQTLALHDGPPAHRMRDEGASKIARLDAEIARAERRLTQLAAEREALERALEQANQPGTRGQPTAEERELARQINAQQERLQQLAKQIEEGATEDELASLAARLRDKLRDEVHALAALEKRLDTPTMGQAHRDVEIVRRHAPSLTAFGSPIIFQPPTASAH